MLNVSLRVIFAEADVLFVSEKTSVLGLLSQDVPNKKESVEKRSPKNVE
jgi:hypothetical protein